MLPNVSAIMLVDGRHEMVFRAVKAFLAQDYPSEQCRLIVWDTGDPHYAPPFVYDHLRVIIWHRRRGRSIGELRNEAIAEANSDVIVTFDSDDWSHRSRISEQVTLLEQSGADAVGYSNLLFWDVRACGQSWLYTRSSAFNVPGSTCAFWRRVWQEKPFPNLPQPGNPQSACEDTVWQSGLKIAAVSSLRTLCAHVPQIDITRGGLFGGPADTHRRYASGPVEIEEGDPCEPRMVASIHGANTSDYSLIGRKAEYRRAPEWDSYCLERMAL